MKNECDWMFIELEYAGKSRGSPTNIVVIRWLFQSHTDSPILFSAGFTAQTVKENTTNHKLDKIIRFSDLKL